MANEQQVSEHMFDSLAVDLFPLNVEVREQSNEKFDHETVNKAHCSCRGKVPPIV